MNTLKEPDKEPGIKIPLKEKISFYLLGAMVLWLVYNQ